MLANTRVQQVRAYKVQNQCDVRIETPVASDSVRSVEEVKNNLC